MAELIRQRTQTECVIASVAMALKLDYDYVLSVAYISDSKSDEESGSHINVLLNALKVNYSCVHDYNNKMGIGAWKDLLWGRRAILSVDSLNVEEKKHAVYWDYNKVLDPQNGNEDKKFFESLEEMNIERVYLLCECGCDPVQKWKIEKLPENEKKE